MNKLFLVCSQSCVSQMEIPFLLNCSPSLGGPHDYEDHWASYELNGESIDYEPGDFGKVRVHDDYWNIDLDERQYYNYQVRNNMFIDEAQLDNMLEFAKLKKGISLLSHSSLENMQRVLDWAQDKDDVVVITTSIGFWERDIELWTMREYNYLMEDERNANFSNDNHSLKNISGIVDAFISKMQMDRQWHVLSSDVNLTQTDWQTLEGLKQLYNKVGLETPSNVWLEGYLKHFYSKQEFNEEKLAQLRKEYVQRNEYRIFESFYA